jgi:glycosyltransferase involved in cell wall biosynthesis
VKAHVLIIPSWYGTTTLDGIFIREHARMMAANGYPTGVIYVERTPIFRSTGIEWDEVDGVRYGLYRGWYPPKFMMLSGVWERHYEKLYTQYVARFGRPVLLHAHGYIAGMAARYLSKRTGIPYVLTEHNTSLPAGTVKWYHGAELRRVYRDAKKLIAVSAFLKRAMQRWTYRTDIGVIYNPVDTGQFKPREEPADHASGMLVFIGDLEERKDPFLLLRALHAIPVADRPLCRVVGKGPLFPMLLNLSKELGLEQHVEWLGFQPHDAITAILQEAHILVSTSRLETFGMTIAEAMCCGLPVVATDSGASGELISEQTGLIVPVSDPATMATAIMAVVNQRERYLPQAIREYALAKFSFPVIATQVAQIYDEVLSNAR